MPGRIDDPMAWRSLADLDLSRARKRMAEEDLSDGLVHLQQAAEKYLKAWLVARSWPLRRIHDLPALVAVVREFGQDTDWFLPTAESLSLSYLAERYPGDFDPMPPQEEIAEYLSDVERLATELQIQQA
jgi:HEPN domain-containing protein